MNNVLIPFSVLPFSVLNVEDEMYFYGPTVQYSNISGGSPTIQERTTLEHGTNVWLELWGDSDSNYGFDIEATVTMPFGYTDGYPLIDSRWEYWQTVNTSRFVRYLDGSKLLGWETNGKWTLDTNLPYGGWTGGPWIPNVNNAHATNDSPGITLDDTNTQVEITNEQFRMYIMFRPIGENSCYVPLGRTDWNWSGHAKYDVGEQDWDFLLGTVAGPAISTTAYPEHPTWTTTAVAQDIKWIEIKDDVE